MLYTAVQFIVTQRSIIFVEKPKIVTKEDGKLIMLIVRYRAESKCECIWSFKETKITESRVMKFVHEKSYDYWESRVELTVHGRSYFDPFIPRKPLHYHFFLSS